MAAAIALRSDYGATELRRLAKASKDADQTRRLLALAAVYDGARGGKLRRSAGSGSRRCATGCFGSMPRVPKGW